MQKGSPVFGGDDQLESGSLISSFKIENPSFNPVHNLYFMRYLKSRYVKLFLAYTALGRDAVYVSRNMWPAASLLDIKKYGQITTLSSSPVDTDPNVSFAMLDINYLGDLSWGRSLRLIREEKWFGSPPKSWMGMVECLERDKYKPHEWVGVRLWHKNEPWVVSECLTMYSQPRSSYLHHMRRMATLVSLDIVRLWEIKATEILHKEYLSIRLTNDVMGSFDLGEHVFFEGRCGVFSLLQEKNKAAKFGVFRMNESQPVLSFYNLNNAVWYLKDSLCCTQIEPASWRSEHKRDRMASKATLNLHHGLSAKQKNIVQKYQCQLEKSQSGLQVYFCNGGRFDKNVLSIVSFLREPSIYFLIDAQGAYIRLDVSAEQEITASLRCDVAKMFVPLLRHDLPHYEVDGVVNVDGLQMA